jgi:hypothetical protein
MSLPNAIAQYIYQQAPAYGVDPNLALGIANAESGSANGALNGNPDSGGMSFGPFQLFFSSGSPLGNNSPSVGTGFVSAYGAAPNASNWQQQVDYSLQTMSQPGGLRNWSTYNNQGSSALTASGQNIANSMGLSSGGSAASGNDPLGSSLTIDPNGASEFNNDGIGTTFDDTPTLTNADFSGLTDADIMGNTTSALGNDQGTPNLGGGVSNTTTAGAQFDTAGGQPVTVTNTSATGQIAGQAVQTGLGTAGTDVENAAGGITGTLTSAFLSLETYTSELFVVVAIVAVGVILIAYGLGLFKHNIAIPV